MASRPLRILHAHSTFSLGGKEARAVRLMNAFGDRAEHVVLSAMPGEYTARQAIAPGIRVEFPADAPPLAGSPSPLRLLRLARYAKGFDLVLTYNWGAFDMVMARRLFGPILRLPPLVHHEDGFNADETLALDPRRNLYRRIGLGAAFRLVLPSQRLEAVARTAWHQAPARIMRIPNGIAVDDYRKAAEPDSLPGFERAPGEIVIGTIAGLRQVKNLPRLVRAFAAMRVKNARLVIVGTGPESERIAAQARECGVAGRVLMPGFVADPSRYAGLFDIFALSSDSEQFPIALVEAMAAGLPAVATAVGDVRAIVSADNQPMIVEPGDEQAFAAALDSLAERKDLRRAIGLANRERAAAEYDEAAMIAAYAALYGEAVGRPDSLIPQKP
jgi:glycosyltransferase involved in cell wall biosynthesis